MVLIMILEVDRTFYLAEHATCDEICQDRTFYLLE